MNEVIITPADSRRNAEKTEFARKRAPCFTAGNALSHSKDLLETLALKAFADVAGIELNNPKNMIKGVDKDQKP